MFSSERFSNIELLKGKQPCHVCMDVHVTWKVLVCQEK